jgi:hypothetical protein
MYLIQSKTQMDIEDLNKKELKHRLQNQLNALYRLRGTFSTNGRHLFKLKQIWQQQHALLSLNHQRALKSANTTYTAELPSCFKSQNHQSLLKEEIE